MTIIAQLVEHRAFKAEGSRPSDGILQGWPSWLRRRS